MAGLATTLVAAGVFLAATSAFADDGAPKPFIPNLFDPAGQDAKPDTLPVKSIRFLTTDDFPPFHFALADGTLAGFDIDLARAICAGLKVTCTIQARRFETLTNALAAGQGDEMIAALANTATNRAVLDFTAPYYTTPARFVTRLKSPVSDVTPEALESPGLGIRHYAPRARMVLVESVDELSQIVEREAHEHRVGVLLPEDWPMPAAAPVTITTLSCSPVSIMHFP